MANVYRNFFYNDKRTPSCHFKIQYPRCNFGKRRKSTQRGSKIYETLLENISTYFLSIKFSFFQVQIIDEKHTFLKVTISPYAWIILPEW